MSTPDRFDDIPFGDHARDFAARAALQPERDALRAEALARLDAALAESAGRVIARLANAAATRREEAA